MKIVVFSGTTEGRLFSRQLAAQGAEVLVSVATPLGAEEQGRLQGVTVHCGRLTPEEMTTLLQGAALCVDATHPYAVDATKNIRSACKTACIEYHRLLRAESPLPAGSMVFPSAAHAAEFLANTCGNLLLATGAKELAAFSGIEPARLFPRVLPTPVVVCYLSHYNMVLAALGGVVTGGLIGLINGYFNVKRKITSFIVTICTMYLFRGVCAYATTNSPVYAVSDISKYNTLPFMLTFTVIIFVVAYLVFTYTGLGSRLKAIGAGETAARFAGIRVETTKILVFVAAGCITGLAAFVNAIKVGSVTSTAGNQLETQIMIALVLGGMPVNGGAKVRFYNIILGVMTYKVLSSGLVMLMMPTQLQQLILGIIFLIEVAIFSDRKTGMIVK